MQGQYWNLKQILEPLSRWRWKRVPAGMTARQLIFSVLSVAVGGGIVLFFYPLIGMTPSVYLAIPAVAPVALGGFYSFNGMNFYEYMGRKMRMLFANRPLAYISTENEEVIRKIRAQETEKNNRKNKGKGDISK